MRRKQRPQQPYVGFKDLDGGVFVEVDDVDDALDGQLELGLVPEDRQCRQRVNQSQTIIS